MTNIMLEEQGRQAAAAFRRRHHLGVQPLGDLVTLIEQTTGHDVAILDAEPDEHGLTMRDPDRDAVFTAVARTRNPMRQRSTLAHELAHIIFTDWTSAQASELSSRSMIEKRADAFARNLLVPTGGLKTLLRNHGQVTDADLSVVVQRFLVSPAIAAIALCEANYISAATKKQWMQLSTPQLATRFGWTDQYVLLQHDSDRRRTPQRLLARAIAGYSEGVVAAQAIATLRSVSAEAASAELAIAGIAPRTLETPWVTASDLPVVSVDLSDLDDEAPESESG